MEVPYDPSIPLLGIQPEETRIERDTCTPVFIATLFTIARAWKLGHGKYPLPDEWIRKLYFIYTMEYYSAIKRNTFESVLMSSNEEYIKAVYCHPAYLTYIQSIS